MNEAICEKALDILQRSNDGEDLDPADLKLLENAVNGFLSDREIEAFDALYHRVTKVKYVRPWLHGIENITTDHEGYIFYKGNVVEHYDYPYAQSSIEPLKDLLQRCMHVELLGIQLNSTTVIWRWEWFKDLTQDNPWLDFFCNYAGMWEGDTSLVIIVGKSERLAHIDKNDVNFYQGVDHFLSSIGCDYPVDEVDYHKFAAAGFGIPKAGQGDNQGLIYAPLSGVISVLEKHKVPHNFFDIAKK